MQSITSAPGGARPAQPRMPDLGEPRYNLAGTEYTAAQFQALCQYGSKEAGYYQLIPVRSFLAWLAEMAAQAEPDAITNGPALAVTFLIAQTGLLWTAYAEGAQPRLAGGPDIGPCIPYTPFERFLVSLPECTPGEASAAILAYLAAH